MTTGELHPEMPPLEMPSTSPVRPTRNVAVPRKSNSPVLGAAGDLVENHPRPQTAEERERHVEPEHPVPGDRDERATEHRSDDEADGGDHRVRPHRHAELLTRERIGDDRGGVRKQERTANALEDPPQDELRPAPGEPGTKRREREHQEAADVGVLAAELVR